MFMTNDHLTVDLCFRGGGSYFTGIPISSLEYRKKWPTHASALVVKAKKVKRVEITDDHGSFYSLSFEDEDEASYLRTIEVLKKMELLK